MLRRILSASACALALAGTAFAADFPSRAPPPVYLPPPPVFTWTGLYIGGQLGYKWGKDKGELEYTSFFPDGSIIGSASVSESPSLSGVIGGAHIGYNWQIAQFVLGVEADVDSTNFNGTEFGSNPEPIPAVGGPINVTDKIRSTIEGSFRGRLGFAFDRFLLYGTGGIAFTDVTSNYSESFPGVTFLFDSRTRTRAGWTAGGGIEYAVTPNWLFGVEYRYSDFGRFTDMSLFGFSGPPLFPGARLCQDHHLTQNRVQARVSYKFDWLNPVVATY